MREEFERGMRKPACPWHLAEAPAAALELLQILLSMKSWLSFTNVDYYFFFMLLASMWCRKQKIKIKIKILVPVFNRETRVVEVQSIFVFVGFQNQ